MFDEERMKRDLHAIMAIKPLFVNLGWKLITELDLTRELKKGATLTELTSNRELKKPKMLETILDILVGDGTLKHENEKYIYVKDPTPIKQDELDFLNKYYAQSMEWVNIMNSKAKEVIISGESKKEAGFDDEKGLEMWDAIMSESPYSLRIKAISLFSDNINDGANILEYGCGGGIGLEQILLSTKKKVNLFGIDTSEKYLKRANNRISKLAKKIKDKTQKENIKRLKLIAFDPVKKLPLTKKFDVVFLSIVLNHIQEEEHSALFKKLKERLKKNGKLIIYQLINQSKYDRMPIWVMHVVPTHKEYPFKEKYLQSLKENFKNVDCLFGGAITQSYD